ncbi:hypothetical protein ETD86_10230 [Nonomuraea turkmeniaca]|uniref:GRAM domain-containing protein n=1 Tax=Nonomuraea turkmeniaca TaxID=103838 RepID=A0A5S4FQ25_9ACTN|nr:GRAM domain-containing protein [Nonomuraea turkmeniaca]TMR22797.1 hypothetical protein ETD86_10230 [Nonomuraea turkmeniaca]
MDEQELAKIFRDTDLVPAPGESVLHKGVANLWAGPEAVGGRLWLTSRVLVFRSHAVNVQTGVWAWPLEEIVSTAPVNTLGIVPNGLEVVLRNGERVRFVVRKRRAWMQAIQHANG